MTEGKAQLRGRLRQARAAIPAATRAQAAQAAARRLMQAWPAVVARCPAPPAQVGMYAAIGSELDPAPIGQALAARGVGLVYPRVDGRALRWHPSDPSDPSAPPQLRPSAGYGIPEPSPASPQLPPAALALFLLPGLAFSLAGARLGYGAGFYDRALAGLPGLRIGVGFEALIQTELPEDPHDLRVDALLTERGLRWMPGARALRG